LYDLQKRETVETVKFESSKRFLSERTTAKSEKAIYYMNGVEQKIFRVECSGDQEFGVEAHYSNVNESPMDCIYCAKDDSVLLI